MKNIKVFKITLLLTFSVHLFFFCSRESPPPPQPEPGVHIPEIPYDPTPFFNKIEAFIPMRDGIRLNTEIYVPRNSSGALPFLMMRTPYGLYHDQYGYYWRIGGSSWWVEFVKEGYIFVVQVQSTWFPLIDRNPQEFVNIPEATEDDYQSADQRVFKSKSHPSHVVLPVYVFMSTRVENR